MKAKFPGTCKCGARVEPDFDIWMDKDREGRWFIGSCPACCENLSRGSVDTGVGMKSPGSNLQRRIERAAEKRRKAR